VLVNLRLTFLCRYRHLGVAPGKWLVSRVFNNLWSRWINDECATQGYGATTLPALTEAITIEKNATLAVYEVERLVHLLEKMAENLS
jgi:N-acetylated-alpha-linked acidic dipeptidase